MKLICDCGNELEFVKSKEEMFKNRKGYCSIEGNKNFEIFVTDCIDIIDIRCKKCNNSIYFFFDGWGGL